MFWRKKKNRLELEPLTDWQVIFLNSPVNGGDSPQRFRPGIRANWKWPQATWLQRRRDEMRKKGGQR